MPSRPAYSTRLDGEPITCPRCRRKLCGGDQARRIKERGHCTRCDAAGHGSQYGDKVFFGSDEPPDLDLACEELAAYLAVRRLAARARSRGPVEEEAEDAA